MLQIWRSKTSKPMSQEQFIQNFFLHPLHQWIKEDKYLTRSIILFVESFTAEDRLQLAKNNKELILTPASGLYSCAFNANEKFDFIIVFPDLIKILKSASPERGVAILLHEAGHLIRGHSHRQIDPIKAQLEADQFCAQRGHGQALYDFLMELPKSEEVHLRRRYLETKLV